MLKSSLREQVLPKLSGLPQQSPLACTRFAKFVGQWWMITAELDNHSNGELCRKGALKSWSVIHMPMLDYLYDRTIDQIFTSKQSSVRILIFKHATIHFLLLDGILGIRSVKSRSCAFKETEQGN